MLTQKYSKEFIRIYDKAKNKGQILRNIILTEEETNIELLKWNDTEVATFLKKSNAISPQSLNKSMVILRKFADFICKSEKITTREYPMEDGIFMQLIDRKQLLETTISYDQYLIIRSQLDMDTEEEIAVNIRDKVIFELAWEGLMNDEIRSIKVSDIEFVKSSNGWDDTILNLDNKVFRIEDSEVTKDIKNCIKELYCVRTAKDGRTKKTFYKESEYLIKPINVGRTSSKTYLDNPHLALQRVLRSGNIICKDIDVDSLTLAGIRRSKLIYMLSLSLEENEEDSYFTRENIAAIFNLNNAEALRWYKKIAIEMYGK